MKLIKCNKCGATIMTDDTLLTAMQDEYNELVKRSHRAKGADKNLIGQQLKHLHKMMVQVCHRSSAIELRKISAHSELAALKKYIITHQIIDKQTLDKIQAEAMAHVKEQTAKDEKKIAEQYDDFVNSFCNRTKADPTATEAMKGVKTR
jgi:coenzyme F420-reducing hydrogenase beta subunit